MKHTVHLTLDLDFDWDEYGYHDCSSVTFLSEEDEKHACKRCEHDDLRSELDWEYDRAHYEVTEVKGEWLCEYHEKENAS